MKNFVRSLLHAIGGCAHEAKRGIALILSTAALLACISCIRLYFLASNGFYTPVSLAIFSGVLFLCSLPSVSSSCRYDFLWLGSIVTALPVFLVLWGLCWKRPDIVDDIIQADESGILPELESHPGVVEIAALLTVLLQSGAVVTIGLSHLLYSGGVQLSSCSDDYILNVDEFRVPLLTRDNEPGPSLSSRGSRSLYGSPSHSPPMMSSPLRPNYPPSRLQ